MKKTPEQLYKFHVVNVRQVNAALSRLFLRLRAAVAADDAPTLEAFTRLSTLLLACWAEARLSKLLYEENGFSAPERMRVASERTQLDRWLKAIELAFRRHYGVPLAALGPATLPHSAAGRHNELVVLLNDELGPVIQLRNRLAHGQWHYPFNEAGDDVVPAQYKALQDQNVLHLEFKQRLLGAVADAIHDLVVSKATFERDFDGHFKRISDARRDLKTRSYSDYVQKAKARYKRGQAKRAAGGP